MQALVLGARGQLGIEIVNELDRRGQSALGVGRSQLDITAPEAVEALVERHKPEWVINCAAYNKVDQAEREPEVAMAVNAHAVRSIAQAAEKVGATLLHYSTDHVFDGLAKEPYRESDPPAPPSAYGISKLAGEHFARAYCRPGFVVRVAGVFGPAGRRTSHGNFPELVLRKAAAGEPLKVVDDVFATPTDAVALAARSIDLLESGRSGLYHIGGGESISWYRWAAMILEAAGLQADLSPTTRRDFVSPAGRPQYAELSNEKLHSVGIAPMPSLAESLANYLRLRELLDA